MSVFTDLVREGESILALETFINADQILPGRPKADLLSIAQEGAYSEYQGTEYKFWFVDEHPDELDYSKFANLKHGPLSKRSGYHMTEGWVSYRGRRIGFPTSVSSVYACEQYRLSRKPWLEKIDREEYVALMGDIYYQPYRDDDTYPHGHMTTVIVPRDKWYSMDPTDQWNYIRDINLRGYIENTKEFVDYVKKCRDDFENCIPLIRHNYELGKCSPKAVNDYEALHREMFEIYIAPRMWMEHMPNWRALQEIHPIWRYWPTYHEYYQTGLMCSPARDSRGRYSLDYSKI